MTYHVAATFPNSANAAQLRAFIAAQGGRVRNEFSLESLNSLNDPRVTHGWRTLVHGVPVYLAVGGPIIANLPAGSWVMASEMITTGEGKTYIRHDGAEIPGCAGWSYAINFEPPRGSDPVPVRKPETWPLETTTCQDVINAMAAVGMMGSIPRAIFTEMRNPPTNRDAFYFTLKSKLPLERWGLRPDRLARAKTALRVAEQKKAEMEELERVDSGW